MVTEELNSKELLSGGDGGNPQKLYNKGIFCENCEIQ